MTFNLRFATPIDGPNEWEFRKELVAGVILNHQPDLLGTQEGTVPQLLYLEKHLPGYLPLTGHRHVDHTCQYPTIFYRADRFQVHESNEFWLSETPTVHRSLSWGSAFPRLATYGLFQETGRTTSFYFVNTHLDHISELPVRGRPMTPIFPSLNRPRSWWRFPNHRTALSIRNLSDRTVQFGIPGGRCSRRVKKVLPNMGSTAISGAAASIGFWRLRPSRSVGWL
jgi:hypothetical protein